MRRSRSSFQRDLIDLLGTPNIGALAGKDAEDLLQELAKDKEAETFYQSLSKTNRFAINFRLQTAKKPETRVKRLREILTNLQLKKM
jgi:hypothetical protein